MNLTPCSWINRNKGRLKRGRSFYFINTLILSSLLKRIYRSFSSWSSLLYTVMKSTCYFNSVLLGVSFEENENILFRDHLKYDLICADVISTHNFIGSYSWEFPKPNFIQTRWILLTMKRTDKHIMMMT
jgi:hypothetical protein